MSPGTISLRIPAKNYAIPPDNPFVGTPDALQEIWALGLRNPWRCSFDRKTSDLYIGDVGQNKFEEIDFQRSTSAGGENYGWSIKEGTHPFKPVPGPANRPLSIRSSNTRTTTASRRVVGGYVYRGTAIPDLQGTYFFADITGIVLARARRQRRPQHARPDRGTVPHRQPLSHLLVRGGRLGRDLYRESAAGRDLQDRGQELNAHPTESTRE